MAERSGFPQIPRPVWYGVRALFNKSLGRKLDENGLAAALDVQPVAARQYLVELRRVGLINEDGMATELAKKWRQDEGYGDAVSEILRSSYPQGLVDLAPVGAADRATVERWFKNHGLGEGTARNKAATYLMIANGSPDNDSAQAVESGRKPRQRVSKQGQDSPKPQPSSQRPDDGDDLRGAPEILPLNVNVQIHISADASTDQIDAIFSSMRKHLYGTGSA